MQSASIVPGADMSWSKEIGREASISCVSQGVYLPPLHLNIVSELDHERLTNGSLETSEIYAASWVLLSRFLFPRLVAAN